MAATADGLAIAPVMSPTRWTTASQVPSGMWLELKMA
jgi:hypothetical protein